MWAKYKFYIIAAVLAAVAGYVLYTKYKTDDADGELDTTDVDTDDAMSIARSVEASQN